MPKVKEIEQLQDHVIETRHYNVFCDFCDNQTPDEEYESTAADRAFELGFEEYTVDGEQGIACAECYPKEEWKKWEK